MRKIFYLFALVLLFAGGCDARKENAPALADDKIYFFYYNECPYCHDAMDYMNAEYPRLKVTMVNIHNPGGYELQPPGLWMLTMVTFNRGYSAFM